jgi:phosphatidate cytidylyltransferase
MNEDRRTERKKLTPKQKKSVTIRSISGIFFMALMIAGAMWKYAFPIVMLCVMVILMDEYLQLAIGDGEWLQKGLSILAGVSGFVLTYFYCGFGMPAKYILLCIVPVLANYIVMLYGNNDTERYTKGMALFSSLVYIPFPLILANLLVFTPEGSYSGLILLTVMILVWANDCGAYIFGMMFGQNPGHKLFPSVSPKKSWEGVWGGAFFTAIAALILYLIHFIPIELGHFAILSVIAIVFADFGDLVESQFKRHYGVKDSGTIMPGHGGLMDRFDSLLFVLPAAVIYLKLTSLI